MTKPNPLLPQWDAPPSKPSTRWKWLLGTVVGMVLVLLVANSFDWNSGGTASEPTRTVMNAPAETAQADVPDSGPADPLTTNGIYKVGAEIQPGTYSFTIRGDRGYFARCSDPNCDAGEGMIANDVFWEGTGYLEVLATDAYVDLKGLTLTPSGG